MDYCKACGAELAPDDTFCTACGTQVVPPEPAESPKKGKRGKKNKAAETPAESPAAQITPEEPGEPQVAVALAEPPAAEATGVPLAETVDAPSAEAVETQPLPPSAPVAATTSEPAPQPLDMPLPAAAPQAEAPPPRNSMYAPITTAGYFGIFLLMLVPLLNLVLLIAWACGSCKKIAKRNFARAALLFGAFLLIVGLACALLWRPYIGPFLTDLLYYFL